MAYGVVDWIIDNSGVTLTKYSDFLDDIREVGRREKEKGKPQLMAYIESAKSDVLGDVSPQERTVKGEIDSNDDAWRDNLITKINKITKPIDLDVINEEEFSPQKGNYNDDWVNEVQKALDEKSKELIEEEEAGRRKIVRDLTSEIEKAETQEDLDKLPSMGEIKREYGEGVRKIISGLVAERGDELQSVSERLFDETREEIDTLTTEPQLDDMVSRLMEMPQITRENRKNLLKQINAKRREIGG